MAKQNAKKALIVELNEFNIELLKTAVAQYSLPCLEKILTFTHTNYRTKDRYNSGFLEPWVQWVSIHTGKSSSLHKMKHLGDVPDLDFEQCWEVLSHYEISCGIWGVMNGAKRQASKTLFFLPDPWTFSEWATPAVLNNLLDLPRYISKNYQNLKKGIITKKAFKLLTFIFSSQSRFKIMKSLLQLIAPLKKWGKKHFIFISFFDYISTLLFIEYKKKYNPQCSILFLNSLAHLQHHHWKEGTTNITSEIYYGLQMIEKIFSELFNAFPDDPIIVHNGLSQMNTNHEKPWVLYRQKDPCQFLQALAITALKVEPHMTHDAHVFFKTLKDCEQAFSTLKAATLNDKPLFYVEKNAYDPLKLFYQLQFTDRLDSLEIEFECNQKKYRFFDYFDFIVTRTGRHTPIGNVLSNGVYFPDHINNHDFNAYLYHYFLPIDFPLRENLEQSLEVLEECI